MKIALAQINTTVGDLRGNSEKILAAYASGMEMGADLVVFPELALCGYPPRDLLDHDDFLRANLAAIKALAKHAGKAGMLVGYPAMNAKREGRPVHNAAALLHRGRIAATRFKTLLPTYDVFDEGRYFEPAASNKPVKFLGRKIGITICEDAWNDAAFWGRRRYKKNPVAGLVKAGAEILVNIAASPFERGKREFRRKMMQAHASAAKTPLVFCGLVGGNDELVFDGNSFALDAQGRLVREGKSFEEDLLVVDTGAQVPDAEWSRTGPMEELHQALVLGIRDYARKCGFEKAVVGLSGGIDSAVTCVLAVDALGAERVTGVSMPSMYSSEGSVADALILAKNLGTELLQLPITPAFGSVLAALQEVFLDSKPGLAEQNIQARLRGLFLMALSNKHGGLLLSTGNKSELSMGYCTLYGDMSGGLAVVADLPKTVVYELARWINRETERIPKASIEKPPSAELRPDQTDQDDLPPYEVLDDILRAYIEEGKDAAAIERAGHPAELVARVLDSVDRNEYKRRQAAPALRVSAKAFGTGRRMPIARKSHR